MIPKIKNTTYAPANPSKQHLRERKRTTTYVCVQNNVSGIFQDSVFNELRLWLELMDELDKCRIKGS